MADSPRYQVILGTFVVITILLALIFWALISLNNENEENILPGWKTAISNEVSFQYPIKFDHQYINFLDWPPQVQVLEGSFTCTEAGEMGARAGLTQLKNINTHNYCVTEITEGAAGSIYTQYAYGFEKEAEKTVIFTFSTRVPQCANYPEPEMSRCEAEIANFDLDTLIDQMAATVEIR